MAHHPIQNSEVYVLNACQNRAISASPPPSPPTPCESGQLSPVADDCPPLTPKVFTTHSSHVSIDKRLAHATHVLGTEAKALACLTTLYGTDPVARDGFSRAVNAISKAMADRGKLVICGVGKSGHIGKKLVATMNSLQITSIFLHPTEALHGDLGGISDKDVILLITFSGRTPELLSVIPHFNPSLPLIVLTSHTNPSTCEITQRWPDTILLPSPIHESETLSFGVNAPTTSTTVSLALGDALAVVISSEMHASVAEVFSRNHPGGAIGAAFRSAAKKLSDLATPFDSIPSLCGSVEDAAPQGVQVILTGYQSPSGWVACGEKGLASPQRIARLCMEDMNRPITELRDLVVPMDEWVQLVAEMEVSKAAEWIQVMRASQSDGDQAFADDAIVVAVIDGKATGVMEIGAIMSAV